MPVQLFVGAICLGDDRYQCRVCDCELAKVNEGDTARSCASCGVDYYRNGEESMFWAIVELPRPGNNGQLSIRVQ